MSKREPTAEQFLKDVLNHEMHVPLDKEVYRHIQMRNPKNSNLWFDIVTWPGNLTIRGDMGCWTFSRVPDMFNFFRERTLKINPSYWSEKVQNGVHGGRDSCRCFDEDEFRKSCESMVSNYTDDDALKSEILASLRDEISYHEGEGEHGLRQCVYEFRHGDFFFDPSDIPSGMVFTYHFIWCLYAIVWTIQQYDAMKERTA
jgi:hypothetical protein